MPDRITQFRIKRLKMNFREWSAYTNYHLRKESEGQNKVVIFAQGRTGSTLLEDLLSNSGHFKRHGELLYNRNSPLPLKRFIYPEEYLKGLARKCRGGFVCHIKIQHLTEDQRLDPKGFFHMLHMEGWRIIYLWRENKFKQVLSLFLAWETRHWHHFKDGRGGSRGIYIDPEELIRVFELHLDRDQQARESIEGLPFHRVVYEKDLENSANHQQTLDRILDFTGLEKRKAVTRHRKVNTQHATALIENYEEVRSCMTRQGWDHYLD